MAASPVALELHHSVEGRARLRPARPLDAGGLKKLADAIASVAGLRRVISRPGTGSLIIEFAGPAAAGLAAIEAEGIAKIRPPAPPPPIGQVARFGLMRADAAMKQSTGGTLDLDTAVALALALAALVQTARGQIVGPASTLAVAALSMLDRQPGR